MSFPAWFVIVAHAYLAATVIVFSLAILLPHLLADFFQIAQCFLVIGVEPKSLLDVL